MISDFHRGWAWTQALLGLQADEIHCCGEPGAIDLVKRVLEGTGDTVEVVEYKRLSGLVMDEKPVGGFKDLRAGDCVVAFSRKNVFKIKKVLRGVFDFFRKLRKRQSLGQRLYMVLFPLNLVLNKQSCLIPNKMILKSLWLRMRLGWDSIFTLEGSYFIPQGNLMVLIWCLYLFPRLNKLLVELGGSRVPLRQDL